MTDLDVLLPPDFWGWRGLSVKVTGLPNCHCCARDLLGVIRQHPLEHRHQLALSGRHRRVGYLRLLPEDLPVRLLGIPDAVELRLARITTFVLGEEFPKRM